MFSKLREPFGTAGLVVAIVALVFALGGGAWALTASTGGGKHKNLKAKRQARGVRGPQGQQGPEGPEGPAGVNGKNGTNGKAGTNGTNGTPGKSVVSGEESAGENCAEGGYWFEIQGTGNKQYVCNGGGGSGGGGGDGTLAPGHTLIGNWSFALPKGGAEESGEYLFVTISYPLQVFPAPTQGGGENDGFRWIGDDDWLEPGDPPYDRTHCPGTVYEPKAEPGFLCFYGEENNATAGGGEVINAGEGNGREPYLKAQSNMGDPNSGATVVFRLKDPSKPAWGYGSWAVTAAE